MRDTYRALDLLFRLSAMFFVSTFGALLLGIWVDRTMGTAPLATLTLMVSGIIVGTVATYRVVREANERLAPPPPKSKTDTQSRDEMRGGQ